MAIDLREQVQDYLNDMFGEDILSYWNEYCEDTNNCDDYIHELTDDFLNDNFGSPADLAQVISGEFYYHDDYVKYDNYGHLVSFDNVWDEIYIDTYFVDWFLENYLDICKEEIWDLDELEAEAYEEAYELWNNSGCNIDALYSICVEVADNYADAQLDPDELYDKIMEAENEEEEEEEE